MHTGPVHYVDSPFTPQLSLVLINRSWRNVTLSWRWYTAATGEIQSRNLVIARSALYQMATSDN